MDSIDILHSALNAKIRDLERLGRIERYLPFDWSQALREMELLVGGEPPPGLDLIYELNIKTVWVYTFINMPELKRYPNFDLTVEMWKNSKSFPVATDDFGNLIGFDLTNREGGYYLYAAIDGCRFAEHSLGTNLPALLHLMGCVDFDDPLRADVWSDGDYCLSVDPGIANLKLAEPPWPDDTVTRPPPPMDPERAWLLKVGKSLRSWLDQVARRTR